MSRNRPHTPIPLVKLPVLGGPWCNQRGRGMRPTEGF